MQWRKRRSLQAAPAAEGVVAEKVADPCDCLKEGLTRGQEKYCRESKRDTRFLEQLRQCGGSGRCECRHHMPSDGQYTMDADQSVIQWRGTKVGFEEKGTVPFRSCSFQVESGVLTSADIVIEMNGIQATSQSGTASRGGPAPAQCDSFDVANHPTAAFTLRPRAPTAGATSCSTASST